MNTPSKDRQRFNLVTSFVCYRCGNKLELSYDSPQKGGDFQPEADDGLTGQSKVALVITVHPCEKCYNELSAPIETLRRILEVKK